MPKTIIKIKKEDNEFKILVCQDGIITEMYEEELDKKRLEGNIYLGKIKNIIKGMQAAFVDIGSEKNALIHIKDLLPKESMETGNVNLDLEKIDINKVIKTGENILVQIKRDCDDQKGPRVTTDIKLTGKYIVIMPCSKFITISQKIENNEEKERLIQIAKKELSGQYGAIIRTSAQGKDSKIIKKDIDELIQRWKEIQAKETKEKRNNNAPIELYDNNGLIGKLITDFEPTGVEVLTDSEECKSYVEEINSKVKVEIKELDEFPEVKRKVWLKCGGFITIDKCEALTAIDVNSGKFTGNKLLEDTVVKVNLQAAVEIAKQIRLNDIGGIIIIDFIDMDKEEDRNKVRDTMEKAVKQDRSKVQVLEFTKLGLLEITRKHIIGR